MPNRVTSNRVLSDCVPSDCVPSDRASTVPNSKGVRDRMLHSRSVILAGYLYAGVAAEAWGRRLNEFLFGLATKGSWGRLGQWLADTSDVSSSPGNLFRLIARDIEESGEAMVDADVILAQRRTELRQAQQHRDRLSKTVYRELSGTRRILEQMLGYQPASEYLGLKGPTPRDPATLLHWAQSAIRVLSNSERAPAYAYGEEGKLKTFELAERLAVRCVPLRQAIDAVTAAYWAEGIALEAQRETITAFDQTHLRGARVLETFLDVLGLPSLARTVRPGVQRRGRPPKRQPVDAYPDLVERMLGDGCVEVQVLGSMEGGAEATDRVTESKDASSSVEDADPAVQVVQGKIEKAPRKLIFGDFKIGRGVRKLSRGDLKIEKGARKLVGGARKSGKRAGKSSWRASSLPSRRLTLTSRARLASAGELGHRRGVPTVGF